MDTQVGNAGGTGDTSGDCEGEEPEDPSSSYPDLLQADKALQKLDLRDESEKKEEDALSVFRQQWQRELQSTPSPQRQVAKGPVVEAKVPQAEPECETDEEKAKKLFLRGAELERGGDLYEAVRQYKRAVQLLPDVEQRLYAAMEHRVATPEVVVETTPEPRARDEADSDEEDLDPDLLARFNRALDKRGYLFEPAGPHKGGHISWLPYELVLVILRWVVSSDLDAISLERTASACRGLYVAARDYDLWRAMCVRTWGIDCGTPKSEGFTNWRQMYIERPRLRLNGCYISKTAYLRHGENSFQDTFYKPWYLIEYYRYLRFFPEGLVLMWTTADEPASCVGHLKHRGAKLGQGIMSGHYRLVGDKVVIVLKKSPDKKRPQSTNTRFPSRRKDNAYDNQEQMYHVELQLASTRTRRNWQLRWQGYSVCRGRDQWTNFELCSGRFPPFAFSAVRHYTAEAHSPL